jgi:hypothetical protein
LVCLSNTTMNKPQLFHQTVDILVKAFFQGTLLAGKCSACAVGNLVAHYKGTKPNSNSYDRFEDCSHPQWQSVFLGGRTRLSYQMLMEDTEQIPWRIDVRIPEGLEQIKSTGYTIDELMRIEFAFETETKRRFESGRELSSDERHFAGLMGVLDVLCDIHKVDETDKESARSLFEAHPSLQPA